jgi:predicted membrane protein (TIGR00267 family)
LQGPLKRSWRVLAGLAFRRYFVNTIFDSTFVAMGIVIGASLAPDTSVRTVVSTMMATSLALGISTGTSVYEAEKVEADIRLRELERAMLTKLSGTDAKRALDISRYLVVFVNVSAPPVVFGLTSAPFLLAGSLLFNAFPAALISIAISISVLFVVGAYLGKLSGGSSWLKGLRMALLGLGTFAAIWLLQSLIS